MKALGREGEMLSDATAVEPGDWYMLRVTPRPPHMGRCRGRRLDIEARRKELDMTGTASEPLPITTPMRGEYVVEMVLRRRGFDAWVPTESFWIRRNRYRFTEKKAVFRPILTGYVLVRLGRAPNWPRLLEFPMILGIVGFGGAPARIRSEGIAKLRRIEDRSQARTYQRLMPTHRAYELGDRVEVLDGPFEGFSVTIVGLTGEAAAFEAVLFGRVVNGTIPLHKIGKIG